LLVGGHEALGEGTQHLVRVQLLVDASLESRVVVIVREKGFLFVGPLPGFPKAHREKGGHFAIPVLLFLEAEARTWTVAVWLSSHGGRVNSKIIVCFAIVWHPICVFGR
jgi:hypothetical protein